jgi:hypothetical protein
MAARQKAAAAAVAAKENPYLQRIIHDEELRDNMVVAYEAGRNAYNRLSSRKAPAKVLMEDKKLHKDLRRSADALRDATIALRDAPNRAKPKSKRKGGFGKLLFVALLGATIAIVVSEDLRNKVLDALFGAEEEFDYTSSTTPSAPPTPVT